MLYDDIKGLMREEMLKLAEKWRGQRPARPDLELSVDSGRGTSADVSDRGDTPDVLVKLYYDPRRPYGNAYFFAVVGKSDEDVGRAMDEF